MKKVLLLPALLLAFSTLMAQTVESKNIQVGAITAPGFTVTLDKDVDLVKEAMEERLDDAKLKTKKVEGYVAALEQVFSDIATDPVSFYTKVEKAGKGKATVSACAVPTNFTVKSDAIEGNLRAFLESFVQYVNKFEARKNMETEQGNLKKAQKAHTSAIAVVEKLEKTIQKDKERIADRQKDIEKYNQKIKECQDEIKELEAAIAKNKNKKDEALKNVEEAHGNVKSVEDKVEMHRLLSE